MSLHTGILKEPKTVVTPPGSDNIDMGSYIITQSAFTSKPDHLVNKNYVDTYDSVNRTLASKIYALKTDTVSKAWFRKHVRSDSIVYKYLGFTALNVKRAPDYDHGNYRGSDALYSKQYTKETKIFLRDISLDKDTTDYDIKLKFYARLIFDDGTFADHDISSGGIELRTRDNYTVAFWNNPIRWVDIDISVSMISLTTTPDKVRFVLIVVEQTRGAIGGNEFAVHCEVNEF